MRSVKSQQGVALVVGLLLLVAITLLAVSSMRDSAVQERMTANLTERELSYQLVEATLVFVQQQVNVANPFALCEGGTPGYYCAPDPTLADRWTAAATVWGNNGPVHQQVGGAEYIAEYMGQWVNAAIPSCANAAKLEIPEECLRDTWRITVRTTAAQGANVMLQSVFRL